MASLLFFHFFILRGETVIISDNEIDIPWAKKEIKEIGYELVSHKSEPYEKKGFFHFGK